MQIKFKFPTTTQSNKTKTISEYLSTAITEINGKRKQSGKFINDSKNGVMSYWYDNGQKWMQENYEMGKKHGLIIGWYKNGKKSIQQNWKNDRKNGSHLMWYSNGAKKEEGLMSDGKEVGRWIYYTDDGNVDKILEHD